MEHEQVVVILKQLVETSHDGEKGFMACAEAAANPAIKAYLTICATRCRRSVAELDIAVDRFGGSRETSGTVGETVHRAWLELRTALTSKSDLAVLEECERAEDHAKSIFAAALDKDLPADVRAMVVAQFEGVKEHHDRVRAMRDEERLIAAE